MLRRANRIALAGLMVLLALFALAPAAGAAPLRQADSVDVDDQAIKDGTLVIAEINATQDGWIVAHTDVNNKPGPVIGHTAVKKGESYKVEIKLEQAVAPGAKLWPMLHIDAGTIGTYEFPGPDVPVVVNNNIVMKQISVKAPGAAAPSKLPNTGGSAAPLAIAAFGALLLLLAGLGLRRQAAHR